MVLPDLPKLHCDFERWHFEAKAAVISACSQDFNAQKMFPEINKERCNPWTYKPRGSGSDKKKDAYRKLNAQLWAALLAVM